jgi:hypothetical protein
MLDCMELLVTNHDRNSSARLTNCLNVQKTELSKLNLSREAYDAGSTWLLIGQLWLTVKQHEIWFAKLFTLYIAYKCVGVG